MAKPRVSAGGGWPAIFYVFRKAREVGGFFKLYKRLRSRNACKTCAFGMGGQKGGMVNEDGRFPEVCKKSIQAQAGDMGKTISETFFQKTSLKELKNFTSKELEDLGRLTFPIIANEGDQHFQRITWNEAHYRVTQAFKKTSPEKVFFYSSGRSSNEAAFLFQIVARAFGTANIHNCSYYCHQASGVALGKIYGSGTSSIVLEDLDKADFAIVIGANPASNHPRIIKYLMELRRRGGKVVIINPVKELGLSQFRVPSDWRSMLFGSKISDFYLQPHVGSDIALLKALLKGVMERKACDEKFIGQYTCGWEEVKRDIENQDWQDLLSHCGVSRKDLDPVIDAVCRAQKGIALWAMGLTHHLHGVDNILALGNLVLARGWLGKPGCGFLPIRGHSNVQGVGSCGVTPQLKKAFAEKMEEIYSIKIPKEAGQDTFSSMLAAEKGNIDAAILLGGNLFASNPDRKWADRALASIALKCTLSTKLNEGHVWGLGKTNIILPVLARDEESQDTSQESMFNYVRLSDGGLPNVKGEMRSEVDIIASIAEGILPQNGFNWGEMRSHKRLREEISKVVPGYEKTAQLNQTKEEFQLKGRTFHEPTFATSDQKAHFHVTPLPKINNGAFRLMTLRSEGQFNTVVYEEEDLYRGIKKRDVVMMAEADGQKLNLKEGDRVWVKNETGQMAVSVAFIDIPQGNLAMYYPEANILVPGKVDQRSRTPAFKSVAAHIELF
jgi:molybdopterin-dependent oxidoreductase alpha subunit